MRGTRRRGTAAMRPSSGRHVAMASLPGTKLSRCCHRCQRHSESTADWNSAGLATTGTFPEIMEMSGRLQQSRHTRVCVPVTGLDHGRIDH